MQIRAQIESVITSSSL